MRHRPGLANAARKRECREMAPRVKTELRRNLPMLAHGCWRAYVPFFERNGRGPTSYSSIGQGSLNYPADRTALAGSRCLATRRLHE